MEQEQITPTQQEWVALYEAAAAFKQLAPWEWMYDSDLFGVQNPESGEIGYCSVMGNLGEHFALGVYRGTAGLAGYMRIQSGEFEPPYNGVLFIQDCIMASYEDRDLLEKEDREQIKQLGLKFRGRNAWPLFRSYRPAYMPWFVDAAEARFLTLALQQAAGVAARFRDNEDLLTAPHEGQFLVRVPERKGDALAWHDTWKSAAPLPTMMLDMPQIDEARVERISQQVKTRQGTWDVDMMIMPEAVQDERDERPYFPTIFLWVDRQSGMVLPPQMSPPRSYQTELQNSLLSLVEQAGFAPKEIGVLAQPLATFLEPIAKRLGIKVRVAESLPALENARESLLGYFDGESLEDEE